MREDGLLPRSPPFVFTRNWFLNRNLPTFRQYVKPFAGKPIRYLELGVFEGQSMTWMCQHVLTHPESVGVGVDPWLMTTKLDGAFMEEVRDRALFNTKGFSNCRLIRGCSAEVLRRMQGRSGYAGITKASVDLCMIDGDHNELAVLDDAQNVLPLMKQGGWMLFDDVENDKPKEHHVKAGIARALHELGSRVSFLWKDRYVECYEVH